MLSTIRTFACAAALVALGACQSPIAVSTSGSATPAEIDFTTNAYQIIQFDREEGKLAQTQAKMPKVKALAQQLAAEADQFAGKLDPVAASSGIKPPTELRNDLRIRLAHMRLQTGFDFDRTYLDDQIASHEEAVSMQDSMMGGGASPAYSTLIRDGQATIKRNLDTLRALRAQMSGRR